VNSSDLLSSDAKATTTRKRGGEDNCYLLFLCISPSTEKELRCFDFSFTGEIAILSFLFGTQDTSGLFLTWFALVGVAFHKGLV
jgi:hypothetical protein